MRRFEPATVDPKLAYYLRRPDGRLRQQPVLRPVCQQSWSQGLLLRRTRRSS